MVAHPCLLSPWRQKTILLLCVSLLTSCTTFSKSPIAAESETHEQATAESVRETTANTPPDISADEKPRPSAQSTSQLEDHQFDLSTTENTFEPLSEWNIDEASNTAYTPSEEGHHEPLDFLGACNNDYSNWNGWETMQVLLEAVETDDCELAHTRLLEITDLRVSNSETPVLETTENAITRLRINLPSKTELSVIAAAMPGLTHLALNGRVVEDLAPLEDLTQLTEIHLSNTQITDLSPIANLIQLTTLDISYNQVQDISAISKLNELRSLNLANNPIRNISPLAILPNEDISLNLSIVHFDLETCPDNLGDICESPLVGYREGLH